jgi:hypothetical protein
MRFSPVRKGVGAVCSCNKNKDGTVTKFVVRTGTGEVREVASEQEARAITRISGGSYTKK